MTVLRAAVLAATTALAACAAAPPPCLLASQKPMLAIDLFFGRDIAGRPPLTDAEWAAFAATDITPRFPDGFSVFDGSGQWLNPKTNQLGREASKMVRVVVPPDATVAPRIEAVSLAYRQKFNQVAVGVVTTQACAAF